MFVPPGRRVRLGSRHVEESDSISLSCDPANSSPSSRSTSSSQSLSSPSHAPQRRVNLSVPSRNHRRALGTARRWAVSSASRASTSQSASPSPSHTKRGSARASGFSQGGGSAGSWQRPSAQVSMPLQKSRHHSRLTLTCRRFSPPASPPSPASVLEPEAHLSRRWRVRRRLPARHLRLTFQASALPAGCPPLPPAGVPAEPAEACGACGACRVPRSLRSAGAAAPPGDCGARRARAPAVPAPPARGAGSSSGAVLNSGPHAGEAEKAERVTKPGACAGA